MEIPSHRNIILTGMPGAGKSTVGVLLAKATGREFIDTDIYIQSMENRPLQEIVDSLGLEAFCELEQRHIMRIDASNAVIATGGSAVYGEKLMEHLRRTGPIVFLDLDLENIKKRIDDLATRGVVMGKGETIDQLYERRLPLYRRWADVTIQCSNKSHQEVLADILGAISDRHVDRSGDVRL